MPCQLFPFPDYCPKTPVDSRLFASLMCHVVLIKCQKLQDDMTSSPRERERLSIFSIFVQCSREWQHSNASLACMWQFSCPFFHLLCSYGTLPDHFADLLQVSTCRRVEQCFLSRPPAQRPTFTGTKIVITPCLLCLQLNNSRSYSDKIVLSPT